MSSRALTVEDLERRVRFGARWEVVHLANDRATVQLCACTGEPVERLELQEPAVIAYLRTVESAPAHSEIKETS